MSLRATKRVIRQLDLAGNEEPVGDEAVKEPLRDVQTSVTQEGNAQALRIVSKLANGAVTDATAALVPNMCQVFLCSR